MQGVTSELATEQRSPGSAARQELSGPSQSGVAVRPGVHARFAVDRLATSALFLAASTALGASFGPWAAGGLLVVAALLPRRRVSVVAAEFGAVLGWLTFHASPARWTLVGVGFLGLAALVVARSIRRRAFATEPRSWALGLGLVGVTVAIDWVQLPLVGRATSWLVLSGWLLAVFLALVTEAFTPLDSLRRWRRQTTVFDRTFGRGSVTRNVVAAGVATGVDFAVFRGLLTWLAPAVATLAGCVVGGVVNFSLNRHWAFDARRPLPAAAMRYVWVSAASAAFNSAAVSLALLDPSVSPTAAWLLVRSLAFLGWNYPMQRDHVFSHGRS